MAGALLVYYPRQTIIIYDFISLNRNLKEVGFNVISNYLFFLKSSDYISQSILSYICIGLIACIYCISAVNLNKILTRGISLSDGISVICSPVNVLLGISVLTGFHMFYKSPVCIHFRKEIK